MKNITLVTAFFDLNRKDWKGFNRNCNKYINYFKFWARIRNKLVVYTNREIAQRVLEIRREYSLENQTIVHIIDDFREIEPEMYASILNAMRHKESLDFRLLRHVPEAHIPDYNYVTMLKTWFMADAVRRGETSEMVAWIDFGYNHGGEVIEFSEDFDFLWQYNFPDKINIFLIRDIPDEPLFETIRLAHTSVMGAIIAAPDYMCSELWNYTKNVMLGINLCGFADDDQTLIQAVYNLKPELFNIYYTYWNMPIVVCGGEHMRIKRTRRNSIWKSFAIRVYAALLITLRNLNYSIRTFMILVRGKQ